MDIKMNRRDAKEISRSGINYGQIKAMLQRAYDAGAADNSRATLNPIMSKATCFNIMWRGHKDHSDDEMIKGFHEIGASNALREFGEYWEGFKPQRVITKKYDGEYHHEEPINIYEES